MAVKTASVESFAYGLNPLEPSFGTLSKSNHRIVNRLELWSPRCERQELNFGHHKPQVLVQMMRWDQGRNDTLITHYLLPDQNL